MTKKILIAGESWTSFTTHVKGFDTFTTSTYAEDVDGIRDAFESGGYMSFTGIDAKTRYGETAVAEVLPVNMLEKDDRSERPEGIVPEILVGDHQLSCFISNSQDFSYKFLPTDGIYGVTSSGWNQLKQHVGQFSGRRKISFEYINRLSQHIVQFFDGLNHYLPHSLHVNFNTDKSIRFSRSYSINISNGLA
jgi:hypothetical protein